MPDRCADAIALLQPKVGGPGSIAVILGTGLGGVADAVTDAVAIPYADIPGFPRSAVSGHAGRLVIGRLEGRRVILLQGRSHYYETGDAGAMRTPIETLSRLGVSTIVITNAAGAIRKDAQPGNLALISDHINLTGANPLIGDTDDGRFVSMTDAYSPRLRARIKRAATQAGVKLHEGVYCWVSGPSFETPAEIRMMRTLGADLVGMSTVPEVILARRFGIDVAGISVVTNLAAGMEGSSPSHGETKTVASTGGIVLKRLLLAFLKGLDDV